MASTKSKGNGAETAATGETSKDTAAFSASAFVWWIVVTLLLGFVCVRLLQDEPTKREVSLLFHGLSTTMFGTKATIQALPEGAPDVSRDAWVLAVFTIGIFLANWGIRLILVFPVARIFLGMRDDQLVKFARSVMEALIYGSFAAIGIAIVPSQPFSWPSENWWKNFSTGEHLIMRSDLRCYYLLYGARYLQAAVTVVLEPMQKDFVEMMVHHIVTIGVIYVSYLHGWNRVGVMVMVLLDPADVPLHLAKLCKYTAEKTGKQMWQFMADRLFEVFAVLFFVTRLVMFGYVCWSSHLESGNFFPKTPAAWTCVLLLYLLLILQIYWFSLIVKVAIQLVSGKGVEDIRDDSPSAKKDQ